MQTPNACVVDGSRAVPLPAYRRALSLRLTNGHAWRYDEVTGWADVVPSISLLTGSRATSAIEVIAHGAPTWHFGLDMSSVPALATELTDRNLLQAAADVFLTGCNTGLATQGYCVAEHLARCLPGTTIHGAAGFVVGGCAALQDAVVSATYEGVSYDGSLDAQHPHCWRSFLFSAEDVETPGILGTLRAGTVVVDPDALARAWAEATRIEGSTIDLLIGPDVIGQVSTPTGSVDVEVLLKGQYLREANQLVVHRVRDPEALWSNVRIAMAR